MMEDLNILYKCNKCIYAFQKIILITFPYY